MVCWYQLYSSNLLPPGGEGVLVSTLNLIICEKKHKRDILQILNLSSTLALPEAGKEYLSPQLLVHRDTLDLCGGSQLST